MSDETHRFRLWLGVAIGLALVLDTDERVQVLEGHFERAFERLGRDPEDRAALDEARETLSLLRTELWVDEGGRRRHGLLERRLEQLTGE
ncbi:hypothetical protein ENSA5_33270 [Enhygromyxa salina]|uniref:Uncharacterized protein n=1 Tax=Enhygromyxa salina TaxID=215803 RepID=A0A2S9XXS4_9BACT|nr:hypothetical protein [Enhygromyxa salina]PRP97530.1 hypothetical protein ENSA5_33270 [Enhygromyxa salina]